MRVALVLLPEYSPDSPYLAQGYLAAVLRKAGHDVTLFDFNVEACAALSDETDRLWSEDAAPLWIDGHSFSEDILPRLVGVMQEQLERLVAGDFSLVGFSVFNSNCRAVLWMIRQLRARRPATKIVVGGPGAALRSMKVERVRGVVDALVNGEGEATLAEIAERLDHGLSLEDTPGTIGGNQRPPLDVADLPIPDMGDVHGLPYRSSWQPIQFSRGCPHRCAFCTERSLWTGFRMRRPQAVVDEMEYRHDKCGTQRFLAVDALLNADVNWIDEIAELIRRRRLDIEWGGNLRVSSKMTRSRFGRLREAGLVHAVLGVESGSRDVLKLMNKGIEPATSLQNIRDCSRVGIITVINILVGYNGETDLEFATSCRLVARVWRDIDSINLSRFWPPEGFDEDVAPKISPTLRVQRVALLEPAVAELRTGRLERRSLERQLVPSLGKTRARRIALAFVRRNRRKFWEVCPDCPAGEEFRT